MADLITIGEPPAGIDGPDRPEGSDREGSVATALRDRYELERLRAENARLDEARRELLETLDLRTRRVNQLLGERNQLERQLVRAEAVLQELNRKLGAAQPRPPAAPARPAAPGAPLWPTLRGLAQGLMRLWPTRGPAKSAPPADDARPPIVESRWRPLIPFADRGETLPVIALVAVGLKGDQRTSVLDIALRFGGERGAVPLVLTDDDDFAPLRSRGMAFEYFPPRSVREAHAPALEWELYLQRRLALIRRKWQPTRVIAFGGPAADVVRLWSESPFEDPSLGALPAAPSAPQAHRSPHPK